MVIRVIKSDDVATLFSAEAMLEAAKAEAHQIVLAAQQQAQIITSQAHASAASIREKIASESRVALEASYASAQIDWVAEQHQRNQLDQGQSLKAFEALVLDALRAILPGIEPEALVAGVMPHFGGRLKRGSNAEIEVHPEQVNGLGAHARTKLEAVGMEAQVVTNCDGPIDLLIVRVPTGQYDLTPSRQIDRIESRWQVMNEVPSFGK
jgi:vacuolar-type H+-ATPase subunit H